LVRICLAAVCNAETTEQYFAVFTKCINRHTTGLLTGSIFWLQTCQPCKFLLITMWYFLGATLLVKLKTTLPI